MIKEKEYLSNSLTYLGLILSSLGIFSLLTGKEKIAIVLFVFSGICDMLDGRFASYFIRTKEQKQFGIQLDSMCDTVSFVIFPAVFLVNLNFYNLFFAILYILCGVKRLTKFTVSAKVDIRDVYFTGLPVTYSALIIPVVYIFTNIWYIHGLILLVLSFLFLSKLKIPKNNTIANIIFILIALIVLITLILK